MTKLTLIFKHINEAVNLLEEHNDELFKIDEGDAVKAEFALAERTLSRARNILYDIIYRKENEQD